AAGCHGARTHGVAELHYRDEAVAARTVPLLRAGIRAHAERRQRAPPRRRERHRNAGLRVVELLHDVAGETLEPVDVSPRRLPRAEVRGELVGRRRQRLEHLLWARLRRVAPPAAATSPAASAGAARAASHLLVPEDG